MAWSPTTALLAAGALAIASCAGDDAPSPAAPTPPPPAPVTASACQRYAAPSGRDRGPGTRARPFRSVQRLANALAGGGTGCLLPGTYSERVRVVHGGRAGRPLVLRGDRATLAGVLWIDGANHVQVSGMLIDGSNTTPIPVQIMGDDVRIAGNAVTTSGRHRSCMILGSNEGYGSAERTVVRDNRFDRCGTVAHGNKDQAIYVENGRHGEISANTITRTAAYGVQLYPNAQSMRVAGNVMRDNGGGVILGGDDRHASRGNVIEDNLITGSKRFRGIEAWWGGATGSGNVVQGNCVWGGVPSALGEANGFVARNNHVAPPGPGCQRRVARAARAHRAGSRRSSRAS